MRRILKYFRKKKKITIYDWILINRGLYNNKILYLPEEWGYKVIDELHEAEIFDIIKTEVGPNKVFYDIGSHYAWFSIAWLCGGGQFVEAFEPSIENGDIINKTVKKNNFTSSFRLHDFGLGDKNMDSKLFMFPGDSSRNFVQDSSLKIKDNETSLLKDIQIKTIDNLFYNYTLKKPDLIKIDVEGFEYKVLNGAKRLLNEIKPKVVVEIHDVENGLLVSEFMSKIGYSMKILGYKGRNKNLPLVLWT
tara:strand:+ start:16908 stop:17651 length:744 start_codon:yes stop_codon:yes gene_type:complete